MQNTWRTCRLGGESFYLARRSRSSRSCESESFLFIAERAEAERHRDSALRATTKLFRWRIAQARLKFRRALVLWRFASAPYAESLHPIVLSSLVADTKTAYAVHENAAVGGCTKMMSQIAAVEKVRELSTRLHYIYMQKSERKSPSKGELQLDGLKTYLEILYQI